VVDREETPSMARILAIEDEADIRQILEYNLRHAGHDVTGVDRGKPGLALALPNADWMAGASLRHHQAA
jgi:CheY-like chemotaxis protein